MRALLAPVGSNGERFPTLILADALKARGHDVLICSSPDARPVFEGNGHAFVAAGHDFQASIKRRDDRPSQSAVIADVFAETRAQFDILNQVARGADVMVTMNLQLAGGSVAEAQGIAHFSLVHAPQLIPSADYPPTTSIFGAAPAAINRLLWWRHRRAANGVFLPAVNEIRQRLDLAPIDDLHAYITRSPIKIFDPDICSEPDAVGEIASPSSPPLAQDLSDWLEAGEPPVFVGFGSTPACDLRDTLDIVLAAITARPDRRFLIFPGWSGWTPNALPGNVRLAIAPINYDALFPRCAAILHHGGTGSTHSAVRSGRPQILRPTSADQFYWSERIRRLGVTLPPLPRRGLTAERLLAVLDRTLADSDLRNRAAELGRRARERNGLAAVVDRLEAHVRQGHI